MLKWVKRIFGVTDGAIQFDAGVKDAKKMSSDGGVKITAKEAINISLSSASPILDGFSLKKRLDLHQLPTREWIIETAKKHGYEVIQ